MPKRTDLKKILLIGSGPIVIGQACEFDYSGTQACKAIAEEGIDVVLVNSNPATIMTDPEFAARTYVEPLTPETLERVLEVERPDAVLPTVGGQTALNLAMAVAERGVLKRLGIELIGANLDAILMAEDRGQFRQAMAEIGVRVPRSVCVHNLDEARAALREVGVPAIIRPSFTLGGSGGAIAQNEAEYEEKVQWGLTQSPTSEVLIEESVLGWKEYELEVMRDTADNVVIICTIENVDAMGVHTGDSVTIAPAQTLTDKEYQRLRDASIRIIRKIGVDTGGSNIQFAVNPRDGEIVVIEMNPRVSRSSALASKATGFPIAKIAAKLALGYRLDEVPNDITKKTPASFEPTIDYVITKIPRFAFEKFPATDSRLGVQMKSVGETMAVGRTFRESLQKAVRSLENDQYGFDPLTQDDAALATRLEVPRPGRLWAVAEAARRGWPLAKIAELSAVDPWFVGQISEIVAAEAAVTAGADLAWAKQQGFSDRRIAALTGSTEAEVRQRRHDAGIHPVYRRIDTCAAEFEASTPYLYSAYEEECEAEPTNRRKVIILGGGPNRIGQGIEFDYCCVHGVMGLAKDGFETIMVNCNPETVSTDYDTSDRLYFEPLTLEDVLEIVHRERPYGVIVQFGGQTPLRLAVALERAGVNILGTSPDAIDRAEDRERFAELLDSLGLAQPPNGVARSESEAIACAEQLGYPVLLRPSYVLGGRAMQIVHDRDQLRTYVREAVQVSDEHPVLIDRFLADAIEVDVDALCDGELAIVGGVMEHIEEAGIHSGDSACSLPAYSLSADVLEQIKQATRKLALELGVRGLMNVQFAVAGGQIYVIEVNPRASRTVPFVSKAIGRPLAQLAARVMAGQSLPALGCSSEIEPEHVSVKEAVFPFVKFPGVDTLLGPEMKSTGEVMGIDRDFARAYAKAQRGAGMNLPLSGTVLLSFRPQDKPAILEAAQSLAESGFALVATPGTAEFLRQHGLNVRSVAKHFERETTTLDLLRDGQIDLVLTSTALGDAKAAEGSAHMRRSALERGIPYYTTAAAARVCARAIRSLREAPLEPVALQDLEPGTSV
ncbi:MAG: carbamoyl-phosphate synthase large subunit [Myxococcales bacterium FL481]|nr:MAG: carbamoyl-phosphate synthase large subunit [Myxococcales bacterium FL481]